MIGKSAKGNKTIIIINGLEDDRHKSRNDQKRIIIELDN